MLTQNAQCLPATNNAHFSSGETHLWQIIGCTNPWIRERKRLPGSLILQTLRFRNNKAYPSEG
jgi:hypothetical protein